MKKKYIPLVLALSCMLAACNDNTPTESKPETPTSSLTSGSGDVTKYTVTATASQDYTVEGLKAEGYAEGEAVTFTVNVTNNAKEIDKVVVNKNVLTPTNGTYSFTMGAANTTITIQLKDKANAKTATVEINPTEIEVGQTATVTLKLDGTAVTSGVTVTATAGADKVTISGTTVTATAAGTVTLKAEATVDGIAYSKTGDLTIKAAQTAADRHAIFVQKNTDTTADVTIQGKVVHKVMFPDGTTANVAIQEGKYGYWVNNTKSTVNVGDYVKLTAKGANKQYPALNASKSAAPTTIAAVDAEPITLGDSANVFADSRYAAVKLPAGATATVTEVTKTSGKVSDVAFTLNGQTFHVNFDSRIAAAAAIEAKLEGIGAGATITALSGIWGGSSSVAAELLEKTVSLCSADEITWSKATATSVVINGADSVQMGSTLALTADVVPAGADQAVTWAIAQGGTGAATISADGVLTPSAVGTVIVEATATGTNVKGTKTITIEAAPSVPVSSIAVTAADNKTGAKIGEDLQLSASVLPANAAQAVTWSSSDEEVATVDPATGLVTFVGDGHVVITASATDESGKTGTIALDTQIDNLITLAELNAKLDPLTIDSNHKATLVENGANAEYTVRGYVVGINGDDAMISDGVNGFTIYKNTYKNTAITLAVGDKVVVTSTWQKYYSQVQTLNVSKIAKSKATMDPLPAYKTMDATEALTYVANKTTNIAGQSFKFENAVIKQEGSYKNLYMGTTKIQSTIVALNNLTLPVDTIGTFTGYILKSTGSTLTIWVDGFTANQTAVPTSLTIVGEDEVDTGATLSLSLTGTAEGNANPDLSVNWSVANKDTGVTEPLATIDQNGVLTAGNSAGVVTVTATSTVAPTVVATFDVTIKEAAQLEYVTLDVTDSGWPTEAATADTECTVNNVLLGGLGFDKDTSGNAQETTGDVFFKKGAGFLYNKTAFSKSIKRIVVTISAKSSAGGNYLGIYTGTSAMSTRLTTNPYRIEKSADVTVDITDANQTFFQIANTQGGGKSDKNIRITSIKLGFDK